MKKTLSILLSIVLAVSSLGAGTAVFADEEAKSASVEFSVYDGGFIKEPTVIEVSADLSDKYGYTDEGNEPTVLDATIAAHLNIFGSTDLLTINGSWILTAFDKDAGTLSYRVSSNYAGGLNDTVKDGDYVEYMFYQDAVGWSDAYTFFEARQKNAFTSEEVTLTLKKEGYDESWAPVILPVANASITVNGEVKGTTDEKGEIALSFDKIGTYKISTENNIGGAPIFAPWCVINVSTQLYDYVEKETFGGAEYLLGGIDSFSVENAVDFLTYLKSGYDTSIYEETFLSSVKENLDSNGGKLVTPAVAGFNSEMGIYGAVIQILFILGINPADFEGYNLIDAFESIDLTASYHPYYYRAAIEAASDNFAKTLCDKYIADFYVKGSGLNYWGFSCDNTAHFLSSIAKYKDSYAEYVEDAKAVIKSYTKENGAYCDPQWAPDVNADSTALAMMAFASVGDIETAFTYYKNLVEGFESNKAGVFCYTDEVNAYATKDALLSLEYFRNEVNSQSFEHTEEIIKTKTVKATTKKNGSITKTCVICEKTSKTTIYYPKTVSLSSSKYTYSNSEKKPKVTVKDSNGKTVSASNYTVKYSNNKKVGTAKAIITFKGNYSGSVTKTFKINPKGTKLTKLTANKKGFTAKWSKQSVQTSGYQIRYSTDKNFKKYNTKTVSSSKTTSKKVSGLKANKKYFVEVRTYKTVNGTKYYSDWSAYKTVKTK